MRTQSEGFASGFVSAPRIHTALTAGAERHLLMWIAQRTPASINPDHLTALGFVAQLLAGAAYALASHNCSSIGWVTVSTERWPEFVTNSARAMDFTSITSLTPSAR